MFWSSIGSFLQVTRVNTEYLQTIASLTDRKLQISQEMTVHSHQGSGDGGGDPTNGVGDYKDTIEREKLSTFVKLQSREIESLKSEIMMLKRKETAQFAGILPPAPAPASLSLSPDGTLNSTAKTNKLNKNFTLPPIPNSQG